MIGHFRSPGSFWKKVKALTPEHLEKTQKFLNKHESSCNFLRSLLPRFIRTFVPLLLKYGRYATPNFGIYNILGGLTWSRCLLLLGYFFGGIPVVQELAEAAGCRYCRFEYSNGGLIRGRMSKGRGATRSPGIQTNEA